MSAAPSPDGHRWGRHPQTAKRTATGSGRTDPPWHAFDVSKRGLPRVPTLCGASLNSTRETARSRPDDGPTCPACLTLAAETGALGEQ